MFDTGAATAPTSRSSPGGADYRGMIQVARLAALFLPPRGQSTRASQMLALPLCYLGQPINSSHDKIFDPIPR